MSDQPRKVKERKNFAFVPRYGQGRRVSVLIQKIVAPLASKQGFITSALLTDWVDIIGQAYAEHTTPLRVSYIPIYESGSAEPLYWEGTVHIRVKNGSVGLTLKYVEPQVIERINSYFGYAAIHKLRFYQDAMLSARKTPPPLTAKRKEAAFDDSVLNKVEDPRVRDGLSKLGHNIWEKT